MKSSHSTRPNKISLSPEAISFVNEKTFGSERSLLSSRISGHRQIITTDPFREICKGSPNSKLKPIILRNKVSPNSNRSMNTVSIKIPDISEDGKFRHNKCILPTINHPIGNNTRKFRVFYSDEQHNSIPHVMSDSALQVPKYRRPNLEIINLRAKEKNEFDVSFGYYNECSNLSQRNPFIGK
ncbi:hypothetical protein SteCoe_19684 [Stentor coeruleus]|uniref:Uncharacterized protein n=1 Tax=Stentor coeruleus TaxID=5963 RepID=A0A1R2BTX0_9CILI|nr:hypothetical protein SteCoe_19684 [Stentor coeruleus]